MLDLNIVLKYLSNSEREKMISLSSLNHYRGGIINNEFTSLEELAKLYSIDHSSNDSYFFRFQNNMGNNIYHQCGAFYLLDPSSYEVIKLLGNCHLEVILDACAAPGGKTIALALMNRDSLIVANEINPSRFNILHSNIERMGLRNVILTSQPLDFFKNNFPNFFDKIVLDAPCSGSGMFRKDKEVFKDWSINKVYRFASLQKELISTISTCLKDGGKMLYSTCSFSKEEDEDVIESFLKSSNDFSFVKVKEDKSYLSLDGFNSIHLLPTRFLGEGHYACFLNKNGVKEVRNDIEFLCENKFIYNNEEYLLDHECTFAKKLNPLVPGVKIYNKNEKSKFSYAYGRAKGSKACYVLNEELQAKKFMHGEEINIENDIKDMNDEEVLVTYKNLRLGYGKITNNKIKNYIPKGVRLMNIY